MLKIRKLKEELDRKGSALSSESRSRKVAELSKKQDEFRELLSKMEMELQRKDYELTQTILKGPVPVWIFAPIAPLIPIVIILLGIFVAVVQTYVFILLTMSYISGAIAEAH